MIDRAIMVCAAWTLLLVLANPFMEGRKRRIAAGVFAATGSVLFIFRDMI